MKRLFFYLSLLSITLACSHTVAMENKKMEATTKEESSSLQRIKKGLLKIWNKRLSRSLFAILHVIISISSVFLYLFIIVGFSELKDENKLRNSKKIFYYLFNIFPILLDMLFLQLRLNDAKLSKWWHIPYPLILLSIIVAPFIHYHYFKDSIDVFCAIAFKLLGAIAIILPILGPMWFPSVSDEAINNLEKKS